MTQNNYSFLSTISRRAFAVWFVCTGLISCKTEEPGHQLATQFSPDQSQDLSYSEVNLEDFSVEQFSNGQLTTIDGFTRPFGLIINNGVVHVQDFVEGRSYQLNEEYLPERWLGLGAPSLTSGWFESSTAVVHGHPQALQGPHSTAISTSGNLYIADFLANRVRVYDSDGQFLQNLQSFDGSDFFDGPANVYIDTEENIWISEWYGHRIFKYSNSLEFLGWIGASENGTSEGFSLENRTVTHSPEQGGLARPNMVAVDDSGNIYVAETLNHRIQKFSPNGISMGWIGRDSESESTVNAFSTETSVVSSSLPGGFYAPVSVTISDSNYLIIADNHNHRIQRFTLDGEFRGWIGASEQRISTNWRYDEELPVISQEPGGFSYPFQAILQDTKLYVADGHNGRIQIITLLQ